MIAPFLRIGTSSRMSRTGGNNTTGHASLLTVGVRHGIVRHTHVVHFSRERCISPGVMIALIVCRAARAVTLLRSDYISRVGDHLAFICCSLLVLQMLYGLVRRLRAGLASVEPC